MKWMFHIPDDERNSAGRQLTITADNWFAALSDGLARCNGSLIANISCLPTNDGSVEVRDHVTGRTFYLHPFSHVEAMSCPPAKIEIFSETDQIANNGAVSYRERLVCVPPGMSVDDSESIARDVLISHMKPIPDEQLVVAVYVYDHRFAERPSKPAVVCMAWQQWNPNDIIVEYPLSGSTENAISGEHLCFKHITGDHPKLESSKGEHPPLKDVDNSKDVIEKSGVDTVGFSVRQRDAANNDVDESPLGKTQESKVTHVTATENSDNTKSHPRKGVRREGPRKTLPDVAAVDGGVMWAFEALQHMFTLKTHDEAAAFIRDTLVQAIPSEACAVLLNTPGKDELYLAAEQGFADVSDTSRVPAIGGIVGAALRMGAVLNIEDPKDERFNTDVDLKGAFPVGNVLVSPVAFEGHTFGVIELFNREEDASFDQTDSNVLSYVAGAFAEFICRFLPSREAEFSDKEFVVPAKSKTAAVGTEDAHGRSKKAANARVKTAAARKTDVKSPSGNRTTKIEAAAGINKKSEVKNEKKVTDKNSRMIASAAFRTSDNTDKGEKTSAAPSKSNGKVSARAGKKSKKRQKR